MKISELHRQLEMVAQEHGDIEIIYADRDFSYGRDRELFGSISRMCVECNTALTKNDFPNASVAVLRCK